MSDEYVLKEDMHNCILLTAIPVPPSSNTQYRLIRRKNKTYHVPAKELVQFRKNMQSWSFHFTREIENAKKTAQGWVNNRKVLSVHCQFSLSYGRVFTKQGKPKKMDISNRLKALHDEIAKLIGVDDSLFFHVSATKATTDGASEFVSIQISPSAGDVKN